MADLSNTFAFAREDYYFAFGDAAEGELGINGGVDVVMEVCYEV